MPNKTKYSMRHHDFIVFIDGVEIPWLTLQMTAAMGQPSTVDIYIEPDDLMERVRPKALVHVFMSDPFRKADDADPVPENEGDRPQKYYRKNYFLAFEGELQTITETWTDNSAALVLGCSDLTNIIHNTSLDLVQLTSGIRIPLINGSTFYGDFLSLSGTNSAMNAVIYAAMGFDPEEVASQQGKTAEAKLAASQAIPVLKDKISTDPDEYYYHEAVRIALKYFTQFNASYRLQALRTRLFDKISGIPDQTFRRLMSARVAQTLITSGFQNVPNRSLGQLLNFMLNMGLHQPTSVFFPVKTGGERNAWSQYLFLPNLYYAIPPSCNWLFKENLTTINSSRAFLREPTRLMVRDPMVGNLGLVHMAPRSLTSFLQSTGSGAPVPHTVDGVRSPLTFNAARTEEDFTTDPNIRGEAALDRAPFTLNPDSDESESNPNLLKYLTPLEVEKGILFRTSDMSIEYFAGKSTVRSAFGASVDADDDEERRQDLNAQVERAIQNDDSYIRYMQSLANYRLSLEQLNRDINANGPFNPWATPGFPAMICRPDRSYRGLLTKVTHTISSTGTAQTLYDFAVTTLFRPKTGTRNEIADQRRLENQLDEAEVELNRAIEEFNESLDLEVDERDISDLEEIVRKSVEPTDRTPYIEEISTFRDWRGVEINRGLLMAWYAIRKARDDLRGEVNLNPPLERLRHIVNFDIDRSRDYFKLRSAPVPELQIVEGESTTVYRDVDFTPFLDDKLEAGQIALNYSPEVFIGPAGEREIQRNNQRLELTYWSGDSKDGDPGSVSLLFGEAVLDPSGLASDLKQFLQDIQANYGRAVVRGEFTDLQVSGSDITVETESGGTQVISDLGGVVDFLLDDALARLQAGQQAARIANIRERKQARDTAQLNLRESLGLFEEAVEQPPVPDFLNTNLLDPLSVEKVYEPVLGSSTALSQTFDYSGDSPPPLLRRSDGSLSAATLQARDAIITLALRIYDFSEDINPSLDQAEEEGDPFRATPLYSQWENEGDIPQRINEFARRSYDDMVTLDDFLRINGLQLKTEAASFGPVQRSFFRMTNNTGRQSYFDKLHDGNTGQEGSDSSNSALDGINDVRQVYPPSLYKFLYEAGRQEFLLEYARRHFVPRGLSGK